MSRDVYVPVMVTIEDGDVIAAHVDFDAAPWMFVDSEANVWDGAADEWIRDEDAETAAITWINMILGDLEYPRGVEE